MTFIWRNQAYMERIESKPIIAPAQCCFASRKVTTLFACRSALAAACGARAHCDSSIFGSQSCALSLCGRCSGQLTRVMRSCCQPGLAVCCLSHTRIADSQPVTACRMLAASAATQSSKLQACTTAALSACLPHLHLPACMAPRKPLSVSAVQQQQDNSPSRPHKRKEISHAAAACSVTCATPSVFTLQLVTLA